MKILITGGLGHIGSYLLENINGGRVNNSILSPLNLSDAALMLIQGEAVHIAMTHHIIHKLDVKFSVVAVMVFGRLM